MIFVAYILHITYWLVVVLSRTLLRVLFYFLLLDVLMSCNYPASIVASQLCDDRPTARVRHFANEDQD